MASAHAFLIPAGAGRPTRVRLPNRWSKASDADTDGAFMVSEYLLTADIPPHVHVRQHESFYVLDGALTVRVGNEEFSANPGDFVFLPSDVPHALAAAGDSPPRLLAIATPNATSGGVWPVMQGVGAAWSGFGRRAWAGAVDPSRSDAGDGPGWRRSGAGRWR
jgi:quercetin dioxygenase-like cupin family protein